MKKTLIILAMVAVVAFMGCSSAMANVSGPITESGGKKVNAQTSSMNILMFTPMKLEKAEEVAKSVASQCGGGEVVNITSHWKTTNFSILSFETLSVSGNCKQ
jgi:outer membrane lipoprotein SlyB